MLIGEPTVQLLSSAYALDWPSERAFPVFPDAAQSIDAADITKLTGEEKALLTSLQGVINCRQPRLYLYWDDDGINKAWLEAIRQHVEIIDWSGTPLRLLDNYRAEFRGAIVYDMEVPDTINLATTLAGARDSVIASAGLAQSHGLPVIQNLQGMFKSKLEVYSYGLQNVYPHLTKRLVTAISPKAGKNAVNAILRDYIVATAAPCIWLDPENPDELPLLRKILKGCAANSAYLGWFPHGHEMTGVTEASRCSVYVVASDFLFNGSLTSGLKKLFPMVKKPRALPGNKHALSTPLEKKIYISLTWSEGDNIQYCQRHLRHLWNDPNRGKVPMGWTITPLLADIAPNILNHFQNTATENDALVVGPSGAGYTNPVDWPSQDREIFLDQTRRYSKETGIESTMWVYNRINGKPVPISPDLAWAYKRAMGLELLGISVDAHRMEKNPYSVKHIEGLAVAGLLQVDNLGEGFAALEKISKTHFDGKQPLFVACSLTAWNFSVGDVVGMVQRLGGEFEVVRPDEQFEMVRKIRQTVLGKDELP